MLKWALASRRFDHVENSQYRNAVASGLCFHKIDYKERQTRRYRVSVLTVSHAD